MCERETLNCKVLMLLFALLMTSILYSKNLFIFDQHALSNSGVAIQNKKAISDNPADKAEAQNSDNNLTKLSRVFEQLANHERFHFFEGVIGVINILPQITLGLQSNLHWPVSFGIRAGASGKVVTSGWHYAQATTFLNVNAIKINEFQTYVGTNLTWRNHFYNMPIESDYEKTDERYFTNFITAYWKEYNYTIYAGFHYNIYFVEIGYEISIWRRYTVHGPDLETLAQTPENIQKIEDEKNQTLDYIHYLGKLSKIYFLFGIKLSLF